MQGASRPHVAVGRRLKRVDFEMMSSAAFGVDEAAVTRGACLVSFLQSGAKVKASCCADLDRRLL